MKWPGPRGQRAGDHLPYARLLDAHTVQLRDGSLLQCLHLAGLAFESADEEELALRQQAREAALRAIADSRLVLHHHVLRRRASVTLAAQHDDPVCALIDRRWRERTGEGRLFVNELFLCLRRRPSRGKTGWAERLSGGLRHGVGAQARVQQHQRELRELAAARDALLAALQPYGARLLGEYATAHGVCSEPLELLSALYNGELRPMLVPPAGDLGQHLPYRRISFGLEAVERAGPGPARDYAALLAFKEYPAQAVPGMFDALLRLPHALVLAESFGFVERQLGQERIALALRRQRAADEDSATLRQGLVQAKDDLSAGRSVFGEHRLQLLVSAGSLAALDVAVADCAAALADLGAVVVREDADLEPAFWAQFPGNDGYAARSALVSSAAFAGLASLHGHPLGQADGNHWGEAVTVLESSAATPYFFNFHRGDLGNFTVIGPSGSGKTVALNFLAAQAQKWQPRLALFDKDRGAEIFIRAIGGGYATLRAGVATGFNPLQLADTPGNRAFLRGWVARLLCAPGQRLDADEEAIVAAAVDANYDQAPLYRRLRWFAELLAGRRRPQPGDLAARLAPWHGEGEHAWLFDHAEDGLDASVAVLGFDMTELLDTPVLRTPAMLYLFHRIEERLDGCPAMIVIDEGWKALDDEVFAAHIRDWMKTLRKRNAIVGFGTQSARDALDSRVASAIIEQAATQLFMPNARAREADYCAGFGLSAQELQLVRTLPPAANCFLVKHGHDSVVARLDLSGMPELLTVLSGRESSVRRLDALRAELGDAPQAWWQALTGSAWPARAQADA